jgi:hypothetical protein
MDSHDFGRLMKTIKTMKPGIGAWLAKMPSAATNADEASRGDILGHWAAILTNTDYDDAVRAMESIAAGRVPLGREWGQLPYAIRDAAGGGQIATGWKDPQYNQKTKQWEYYCLECKDIGMLTVTSAETQEKMHIKPEAMDAGKFYTCAVACTCGNGDIKSRARKAPMTQYNERTMCRITTDAVNTEDQINVLRDWLANRPKRDISEHPGFTDFKEFN